MPDANPKSATLALVIAAIGIVAAILIPPMFIKKPRGGDMTAEASNLRQIGLALYEFESDYGAYPSEATAALVTQKHPDHGYDLSGTSTNALFRQLFAAKLTQSEQMFYAEVKGTKKPDGVISPGELLKKGEVGFGYIAGLSSEGNPARPIAFCPIIPGTDRFDPKPFKGKAVILRVDNSVTSLNIAENGHAISGGTNILSPKHPVWDGQAPGIRYPE
jgi:type II secretory pathway pseudopilin PulG